MPHLTLEYSANVAGSSDFQSLFDAFHQVLHRCAGVSKANCKSRARVADPYLVAEDRQSDAFVHLEVRLLEGRSSETKRQTGSELLELLRNSFKDALDRFELQITVEIVDIERASYFKHPPGTLSK